MGIFRQYSSHIGWGNTQPKPIVTHSTSDFLNNSRLDTTVHCDTDDRGIGWVKISTVTCLEGKHDTNKMIGSGIGCKLQLSYASRFLWTVLAVLYTTRQSDGQQFSSDVWLGLVHKWLWMVCILKWETKLWTVLVMMYTVYTTWAMESENWWIHGKG